MAFNVAKIRMPNERTTQKEISAILQKMLDGSEKISNGRRICPLGIG